MANRKASEIEVVAADAIKVSDLVWIYGRWIEVQSIKLKISHPLQFKEYRFSEFPEPIRIPTGWKVERKKQG